MTWHKIKKKTYIICAYFGVKSDGKKKDMRLFSDANSPKKLYALIFEWTFSVGKIHAYLPYALIFSNMRQFWGSTVQQHVVEQLL